MSNITGLPGTTPTPELPRDPADGPGGARPAGGFFRELGSWFRSSWNRLVNRGHALRRADGDVQPSRAAQQIIDQDKSRSFGDKGELVSAYKERLGALDAHYRERLAGAGPDERGGIEAEARRADFELTRTYAVKARGLVDDAQFEPLVDELLASKQGLEGLGVDARDYKADQDRDGLSARAELIAGSSDFAVDTDVDGLTDLQEVRAGLDPSSPRTEKRIDSEGWDINGFVWYPYFDDKPVLAFSKYDDVFGATTSREFEPFFEGYAAGTQGTRGTWVPNSGTGRPGYVREADFARTSGVNPVDEPRIPTDAVRLMRRSGAPQDARFALRGADGSPIDVAAGDSLRPTFIDGGQVHLAEARSVDGKAVYFKPGTDERVRGPVAYRPVGQDGEIRGAADAKVESRTDLLGLQPGLRFDFLDRAGRTVDFDPEAGDKVVATFKDGADWVALVPDKDAGGAVRGYERLRFGSDGARRADGRLTPADAERLIEQHASDGMYRVLGDEGLRGDGEVSSHFDVYWWGKCHNTAKIDQSNLPKPEQAVRVARGLEPGDTLAAAFDEGGRQTVLRPARDAEGEVTGYTRLVNGAEQGALSLDEARALAADKGARPVAIDEGGAVRDVEVVTVSPEEVQTLVAHMGAGATEYKGSVGSRFYSTPDRLTLADGGVVDNVRILSATLASGASVPVQEQVGGEWKDRTRGLFRGADLQNRSEARGFRNVAFSESSMGSINAGRDDKIASVLVQHADGRTEEIPAERIGKVGRENAYDLSPQDIWKAAQMIEGGKSFTLEKATGPQVWNYAVKELGTERIDRARIPAGALAADDLPGALAGTSDKDGRLYFRTNIDYLENGETHDKAYYYWVKMDDEGRITDYNYLVDPDDLEATFASAPDFFWQTHVKDPVEERWHGEAEVAGAAMSDIQGLYNASIGNMDHLGVLGVFTADDLADGRPRARER